MSNKTFSSIQPILLLKNSLLITVLSAFISLVLIALFSVGIMSLSKYENFYPILKVFLQIIPAFISGKLLANKYRHSLIFLGLLQGIVFSLLLFTISYLVSLSLNFDDFLSSLPYIISTSVFGSVTCASHKKTKY